MAAGSRRRHFIILVVVCCISFVTFTWYTRTEDVQTLRDMIVTQHDRYLERKAEDSPLNSDTKYDTNARSSDVKSYAVEVNEILFAQKEKPLINYLNPSIKYYKKSLEYPIKNLPAISSKSFNADNSVKITLNPELRSTELKSSSPEENEVKITIPKFTEVVSTGPTESKAKITNSKFTEVRSTGPTENEMKVTIPKFTEVMSTGPTASKAKITNSKFTEVRSTGPTENEAKVTIPKFTEMKSSTPTDEDEEDGKARQTKTATHMESTGPTKKRVKVTEMKSSAPPDDEKLSSTPKLLTANMDSSESSENEVEDMNLQFINLGSSGMQEDDMVATKSRKQVTDVKSTPPTETTPILKNSSPLDKGLGLLINTPSCKIPKLDPWDPTVKELFEKREPYECPGPPLFMKPRPGGSISLSKTVLEEYYKMEPSELNCSYRSYRRKYEEPGNVRENDYVVGKLRPMKFGVPLKKDYVGVFCEFNNETLEQYFPLVRLRKEIEKDRLSKVKVGKSSSSPPPRLNVILAGIDSISKLNFIRHFPRTRAFLKEKMSPFEMKGYTKVGDNTFPNLVPLLTGHFVEHYWNESVRDTMFFDDIDLIWKDYAKKGYRTFYAEDSPYTGTFNYIKRGFHDPPTDYYYRPIGLVVENSNLRTKSKSHCFNSQLETEHIYDYLRNFIKTMGDRPYNAFAMVSTMTHDYLNNAGYADEPAAKVLRDLWNSGALNKSALVLFSDHGLRFGAIRHTYIGKFEERMPFMYVHFPKWFLDQHPEMAENLKTNQERLVTLFDVHATMIHLLDPSEQMSEGEKTKSFLGSSLLNEISPNRTCEEANILPHWCPCQTYDAVPTNDSASLNASQSIVDDINRQLEAFPGLCAVLEIDEILDVRLGQANDLVLRFVRHDNVVLNRTVVLGDKIEPIGDYLVTLTTKPGGAVFEGTVRHDPNQATYTVLGISRINMYGNQSKCIDSQKMKIFCYCNS